MCLHVACVCTYGGQGSTSVTLTMSLYLDFLRQGPSLTRAWFYDSMAIKPSKSPCHHAPPSDAGFSGVHHHTQFLDGC